MEMIEIEAFLAVAREGQFTRAALLLRLSQPAVSRRIETLENELGVRLFERIPQGVLLTPAGRAFLPHAERIAAAAADARRALGEFDETTFDRVSVALVGTLASTSLPRRLRLVRERFPDVQMTIRTARSDQVSQFVRQGDADIGLRYFDDATPGIVSLPGGEEALVVVAAADSPLADRSAVRPHELASVSWVSYPIGLASSGEPFARVLRRQLGLVGLEPGSVIEIDSLTAQKRLIEAGFGIGMLPASAIDEEIRLGTLAVVPVAGLATTVPIVAIHRRGGYLSRPVRYLLMALRGDEAGS